jgi:hypothetical protein
MIRFRNRNIRPRHLRPTRRRGALAIEVLVACSLLIAMIGLMATLTSRIGAIVKETRHYRLAINELSNQMERLSAMEKGECEAALAQLTISSEIRESLDEAQFQGRLLDDSDGVRVVLELNWNRNGPAVPVSLTGWLKPSQASSKNKSDGKVAP